MTSGSLAVRPQLRWSSVRDCGRKAVFEATNAPHRDRTLQEERHLYRGRSVGHDFVVALAHENRWKVHVDSGPDYWLPPELRADDFLTADAIAEMKVTWPLGTGHADLCIAATDTVLEVLSSQTATADMIHSKLLQARGYAHYTGAQSIALAIVDPATLVEERVIVTSTSAKWNVLLDECLERVAAVQQWADDGTLPDRVCEKPSQARSHFCLYGQHCFEGWEADPLPEIRSDKARETAAALAQLKQQRQTVKAQDAALEERQKDLQDQLADLVPPGKWQIDGYRIVRSPRTRDSFQLPRAREDGRFPDVLLDEFTKTSRFDVWTVEATTGGEFPNSDDYGEVPF